MKLRYRYRIYPTDQQKRLMSQLFGCCRVVFNEALAYCQEQYRSGNKKPNIKELSKRLTDLKKTTEKQWLTEVSSIPLQLMSISILVNS
ncbi:helix-turn-helix domain-containing protein [Planktothrix serta]|nr:helix-turn-helix domain-containing protein [Planktothrix serta]